MAAEADTNEAAYFSPDEDSASETQSHSPAEADDGDDDEDVEGEELETDEDAEEGDETEDDEAEGDKPKAEEFKEIERGGKKYRIPAELEPELMMHRKSPNSVGQLSRKRSVLNSSARPSLTKSRCSGRTSSLMRVWNLSTSRSSNMSSWIGKTSIPGTQLARPSSFISLTT